MNRYLEELGYDFWTQTIPLTTGLERILNSPFIEGNGLLVLNVLCQKLPSDELPNSTAKCEYEDFENHFHIDDYVPGPINYNDIHFLGLGLEFLKRLTTRLQTEFAEENIRVTLSYGKVEDEDVKEFGNCVVRFYKVRPEAESVFRTRNLDDFKLDGVLEIETKD